MTSSTPGTRCRRAELQLQKKNGECSLVLHVKYSNSLVDISTRNDLRRIHPRKMYSSRAQPAPCLEWDAKNITRAWGHLVAIFPYCSPCRLVSTTHIYTLSLHRDNGVGQREKKKQQNEQKQQHEAYKRYGLYYSIVTLTKTHLRATLV